MWVGASLLSRAWLSGFMRALRTADAIHLASASNHGQTIRTTDKQSSHAARTLGVNCRLIA